MNPSKRDQRKHEREVAAELAELRSMPNVRILDKPEHGEIVRHITNRGPWPVRRKKGKHEPDATGNA